MARRHRSVRFAWCDALLERRELPSGAVAVHHAPGGANLFHHNGIDGLVLHKAFNEQLNDRLTNSAAQAARVTQAFQVFVANYAQLPVAPPPGSSGPTLASLVANLTTQVDYALSIREVLTNDPTPSQSTGLRVSPLAPRALIPFANAQIAQLGTTLAATPPVAGTGGSLVQADATPVVNVAVNAILNALAESSIHPNLFQSPSDYYLSPDVTFTINSSGAPASSSAGYFVRGPRGAILPGAPLHPHVPI